MSENRSRSTRGESGVEPATSGTGQGAVSVALFARGTTDARAREETVLETLRELQGKGRIDGLEVHTWPGEVSIATETRSDVLNTFEAFEAWAREHGASIRPPFAIRDRRSEFTNETDTLLITPSVCVAVYDAGDLVGVFPCIHGRSVTTIDDCLKRLADEEKLVAGSAERGSSGRRGHRTGRNDGGNG